MGKKRTVNTLFRYTTMLTKQLSEKQLLVGISVLVGIASALAVFLFEGAVGEVSRLVQGWINIDKVNVFYLVSPVIGIILVTLFLRYGIRDNISHGVTRVMMAITHKEAKLKPHNMYSSMVSGAVTIGFGGSVGPEAPIVMTGAAVGSNIAQIFRMGHRSSTILLGCGAAAALAAIFKAPVTGVVFVLEVLMISLNLSTIIPLLIAAVTSTSLIYLLHGFDPVFKVTLGENAISIGHMPYYLLLAVLCGLVAHYLIFTSSKIEQLFGRIKRQYVKWIIGGTVIGGLIFLLPPLFGQGYGSITSLLQDNPAELFNNTLFFEYQDNVLVLLGFLLAVMLTKSIAMACTNAAGGVGGVFAPSLFIGAFTGFFTATLLNTLFGLSLPVIPFTLVGMAGVMSGAMDSPLTAIFLIAEVTGGYRLFLPLMLVSAISYGISYYFNPYSVYTRELVMKGDTLSLTKERAMLFIDLDKLIESDFTPIHAEMTLGDLIKEVEHTNRNIFPVVDEYRHLIGYVTLDDIRQDMFNRDLYNVNHAFDYMSVPPAVISRDDNIAEILRKFDETGAWNLPVVGQMDKKYIGFISKSKIFSEYRNELQKN